MKLTKMIAVDILKNLSEVVDYEMGLFNLEGVMVEHTRQFMSGKYCNHIQEVADQEEKYVILENVEGGFDGLYWKVSNKTGVIFILYFKETNNINIELLVENCPLLERISNLVFERHFNSNALNFNQFEKQIFLKKWIHGEYDKRDFYNLAKNFDIIPENGVTCALLRIERIIFHQAKLIKIEQVLRDHDISILQNGLEFIIIINSYHEEMITQIINTISNELKDIVDNHLITVGRSYYDCLNASTSYTESQKTMTIYSDKQIGKIYYNDVDLQVYLNDAPNNFKLRFVSKIFTNMSSIELQDYCDFINIYIRCNGSIKKMVESLYVHKNTVQYRIQKLHDLTGCDLRILEDAYILKTAIFWYENSYNTDYLIDLYHK